MELFDLPLSASTHLTRLIKKICLENGYSYTKYKKAVYVLLETAIGKIWTRRRKIFRVLRDYGVVDQRSEAWLQKRSEMITASEVTKAFKTASPSARYELLRSKIQPKESAGSRVTACLWGTQFEPIIKKIYSSIQGGAKIVDTSCVRHSKYAFLGASPDGIVITQDPLDIRWGRLVEFKCPISRQFTQDSPIPECYYHQMQLQLECTGLDECDYVEAQFKTCKQTEYKKSKSPYKGVIVVHDSGNIEYINDNDSNWRSTLIGEYRIVYWTLENLRIQLVKRDFEWMSTHLQELEKFWSIVEECRKDPAKIDQYAPRTARHDGPSETLLVDVQSQEPEAGLSFGHTMKLRLDE